MAKFDRLLKVEEYRQAAEKLRDTSRFLDSQINGVREGIARAEGELSRSDSVDEEHKSQMEQIGTLAAEIQILEHTAHEKRHVVETLNEIERVENALSSVRSEQKRTSDALLSLEKAHKEIAELAPKVKEQDSLETTRSGLRERIAAARAVAEQAETLRQRVDRLRNTYRENAEQIKQAEASGAAASQVEPLSARDAELIKEIAHLNAALERDRKFQDEIRNGLCPILSESALTSSPARRLSHLSPGSSRTSGRGSPPSRLSVSRSRTICVRLAAPSGWNLLGRTPVRTYHPQRDPVFLIEPGDAIAFYAIDESRWHDLDLAAAEGKPVAELAPA